MNKICCLVLVNLVFAQISYAQESSASSSVSSVSAQEPAISAGSNDAEVSCGMQDICSPDLSSTSSGSTILKSSAAQQASDNAPVETAAKNTTATLPAIEQNTISNMPSVKIAQLDGGVSTIKVMTSRVDGSKQIYTVKVDRQGNKETMITIIEPDGSKTTRVVAQGDQQVQVGTQPRVIISNDGILVNANAAVVGDGESRPIRNGIDLALPDNDSVEEFEF